MKAIVAAVNRIEEIMAVYKEDSDAFDSLSPWIGELVQDIKADYVKDTGKNPWEDQPKTLIPNHGLRRSRKVEAYYSGQTVVLPDAAIGYRWYRHEDGKVETGHAMTLTQAKEDALRL